MNNPIKTRGMIEDYRARVIRLTEASLRINASLDLNTVLHEVMESARAFTDEDEEILVLFASQAATAISNARTYRKERRARADLDALIETAPVGVAVLDANTGAPVSLNRETRRIVQELRTPGQTFEQLLDVLTYRRGDGREISPRELPLAPQHYQPDTVRAEEITLAAPDGRSVTTLVNATPIHSADGALESIVVTLQDLAPLQEIERLRAQFVGMVSQELRAPLTSLKGSAAALLDSAAALDPAEQREYARIIDRQADRMRGPISELLDAGRIETGTLSVRPESWDVAALVDRARHTFLRGGSLARCFTLRQVDFRVISRVPGTSPTITQGLPGVRRMPSRTPSAAGVSATMHGPDLLSRSRSSRAWRSTSSQCRVRISSRRQPVRISRRNAAAAGLTTEPSASPSRSAWPRRRYSSRVR